MARIVIGGFDQPTAAQLAMRLRVGRHDVRICEAISDCDRHIIDLGAEIDLVVMDGTADPGLVDECFKGIADLYARRGRRPMLLCVSRVYHGPRFEMDLENKGARLVYVH
jgi:hypothetical protein